VLLDVTNTGLIASSHDTWVSWYQNAKPFWVFLQQ